MLFYTDGDLEQHHQHVPLVLQKLDAAYKEITVKCIKRQRAAKILFEIHSWPESQFANDWSACSGTGAGLQVDFKKCELWIKQTRSWTDCHHGWNQCRSKEDAMIHNWATPRRLRHVRSIIGFCGLYRQFVKNLSKIIQPLPDLDKTTSALMV